MGYIKVQPRADEPFIPVLYKVTDSNIVGQVLEKGRLVFTEATIPLEYKYIKDYVVKNQIFIKEDEWMILAPQFYLGDDVIVYIKSKLFQRFIKGLAASDITKVRAF
jgi:hypothetical protein